MKKYKYILSNSGKFHHFEVAKELYKRNQLEKIICGYPWFKLRYEVVYFYNVYGPRQIKSGDMATVIGIFEKCYEKNIPLPVVKPGTQTRRFTHIQDTILVCYEAWKKNKCLHYSISNKKSFSIAEVAKLFKRNIKFLPKRVGERYASALTNLSFSNKVHKRFGKIRLKDYINSFIKSSR